MSFVIEVALNVMIVGWTYHVLIKEPLLKIMDNRLIMS